MRTHTRLKSYLEGDLNLFKENGIYYIRHISKPDRFYIGSTFRNHTKICRKGIYGRLVEHFSLLRYNKHHSPYLQNTVNKYGISGLRCCVLETGDNQINILKREQFYMDLYNAYDNNFGYNVSKLSSHPVHNEEVRRNNSIRMKLNNPMKNKETVKKVQTSLLEYRIQPILQYDRFGYLRGEYDNIQLAASALQVDCSNIYRAIIGNAKSSAGYIWIRKEDFTTDLLHNKILKLNTKYKQLQETIDKISKIRSKKVYMYDLRNSFIREFESVKEASNITGLDHGGISRSACGKQKYCGQYKWSYTKYEV